MGAWLNKRRFFGRTPSGRFGSPRRFALPFCERVRQVGRGVPAEPPRAGMTLIELISAMAIFMLIVGALMVGTNNALDTWRGASARTRTLGRGRAALGLLTADLLQATTVSNLFVLARDDAVTGESAETRSNSAIFDRADATPSAIGGATDGRVTWRVIATNNTSTLVREMLYVDGRERSTEVLDGVTRLRFSAVWDDPDAGAVDEIETNALPATVDVLFDLVPAAALRKAARIKDEAKQRAFIVAETLPLTTRVTYPHSRVPPSVALTNRVTLTGRVFEGNRDDDKTLSTVDFELTGGPAEEGTRLSASDGDYTVTARRGVRPIRVTPRAPAGRSGRFTPRWQVWRPGAGSRTGADFVWRESDLEISGKITIGNASGKPVADVLLDFPMAGQVFTDKDGEYRIGMDQGWPYSGERIAITPIHPRYPKSLFTAAGGSGAAHTYQNLSADETGRDYYWIPPDLVLSGQVVCAACRTALNGIDVMARGDDGATRTEVTGAGGRYSITLSYGWSGNLHAEWRWNVAGQTDPVVGRCLPVTVEFNNLEESTETEFRWWPTAQISGTVYRATFRTNALPVTFDTESYTNCADRVVIPGGVYPGYGAAISNAVYTLTAPHQWYHTGERRILFVDPTHSQSNGLHGVYQPWFTEFAETPRRDVTADFTWMPCDLSLSGVVTNAIGGPVTNEVVHFLSNCIALAPTNDVSEITVTNIVGNVTNVFAAVVFATTGNPLYPLPLTNRADTVGISGTNAFLFTEGLAFTEFPWVRTAPDGTWSNWVSYGWSGAVLPFATNGVFTPPAVFVTGLTSNLTDVGFSRDFDNVD